MQLRNEVGGVWIPGAADVYWLERGDVENVPRQVSPRLSQLSHYWLPLQCFMPPATNNTHKYPIINHYQRLQNGHNALV
jgi:hypothetical protein